MKQHVNLLIATPGHSLMGSYVRSLLDTLSVLGEKGISATWLNGYASHVADAREITLSGTYSNSLENSQPLSGEITYDKIMWIDSDIAWKPEDVLKLYESDKDIISGAYLLSDATVTAHPNYLKPGYKYDEVVGMFEPVKIWAAGMGFMCVKKGVFESIARPWFQSAPASVTIENKEYKFNVIGEDMSFCEHATKAGFEIWFDPTVRVTHHKTMKLTWEGIQP
jgi:hypothetical protein